MDLHLDVTVGPTGLARDLAGQLRAAVREKRLRAGERLPASRSLAVDLGVSRGVVVEAYQQLVAEGILVARQGSGTRVAPVPPTAVPDPPADRPVSRSAAAPRYDLRAGRPDLSRFPRQRWMAAIREALRELPTAALDYPDAAGVPALREALARYLRRVRAADADSRRIVIVGGVAQGLSLLTRVLGAGKLAIEDPCSFRQIPLLRAFGAELVPVPVDRHGVDVAALADSPATAVLVTPAHQYPTGVVLSPRRRSALRDWSAGTGGIIIEDDYDAEFRYDRDPVGCLQGMAPDRTVLVGSVSKAMAPALRLGWVLAPPRIAEALRDERWRTDLGAPVLEQYALARMLAAGDYDRHLRAMRRRYRARRDATVAALRLHLPQAVVHGVSAGLHLQVELPGCDEAAVVAEAARRGVGVAGVRDCRQANPGPPAVILGFAGLPERHLAEAVRLLAQAVRASPDRPSMGSTDGGTDRHRSSPDPV